MTKIVVLPHETLCPDGAVVDIEPGESVCQGLLDHGIEIEHACEMNGACTTCHVIIREGGTSINQATEKEDDMLDLAWGVEVNSRLSCRVTVGEEPLTVEIPKYTINLVRENKV